MKIGIYLIWLRPGIVGGTESFVRNLLEGFGKAGKDDEFLLFTTKCNHESFAAFEDYPNMKRHLCPVDGSSVPARILWENLSFDAEVRKSGVDILLVPVYCKPRSNGKVPYVTVIHDLQALHFPEYFSGLRRKFLYSSWKRACRESARVVTISEYCREDLKKTFGLPADRVEKIYDPIAPALPGDPSGDAEILSRLGLRKGEYDYCVSSLLPHKNLATLLRAVRLAKEQNTPMTLAVSGVGGDRETFEGLLRDMDIRDCVVYTGFVSDAERDALYRNCRTFLFPSIFEGFGMPPIEALRLGRPVICTRESCIPEVTQEQAVYVKDPYDEAEWLDKISEALQRPWNACTFEMYDPEVIASQYLDLLHTI